MPGIFVVYFFFPSILRHRDADNIYHFYVKIKTFVDNALVTRNPLNLVVNSSILFHVGFGLSRSFPRPPESLKIIPDDVSLGPLHELAKIAEKSCVQNSSMQQLIDFCRKILEYFGSRIFF